VGLVAGELVAFFDRVAFCHNGSFETVAALTELPISSSELNLQ